ETLEFSAIQGLSEPVVQSLYVYHPSDLSVVASPWIELTDVTPPGFLYQKMYSVKPIPTSSMNPGDYLGEIIFSCEIESEVQTRTVTVNYELKGFVVNPYPNDGMAFTLDPKFFEFYTS